MTNYRQPFTPNIPYHVFNRGFQKNKLFYSKDEYAHFLTLADTYVSQFPDVEVMAYCLLPNHFHLILRSKKENHDISHFMHRLQMMYARFFKKMGHGQGGIPVFEGRFKTRYLDDDQTLQACFQYVNLNAVGHGIVKRAVSWPWSSCHYLSSPNNSPVPISSHTLHDFGLDLEEGVIQESIEWEY